MCYALPPKERISRFNYIVLPVHLNGIHWGIIIVSLIYHGNAIITPYYYEPLLYRATVENVYEENMEQKSNVNDSIPCRRAKEWIDSPRQPDGTSCGVLCITQAYDILNDFFRLARTSVTAGDIAIMRLRIMWMILSQPDVTTKSNKLAPRCRNDR
ncbi:LOW QUALITY PROTEIN: Ubiquitin carboxyl-terminal hydrolase [Phytophthora palmivora]|uniref:Ubiquitin carboxyl-terminal hydrolase n=1 Tax=Phytophthora palmivora TaxID=4796 RepID=A0A2P4X0A1_9STRA|nr:LOW QUALITY PROTEIN: Ubiquitin carboxyl-terminal hydrolase [Phytophthora palmivora]